MARAKAKAGSGVVEVQAKTWPPSRLEFARMERRALREMRTCPEEITFDSWPPDWDLLPESDGLPVDSTRHAAQMNLLVDPLRLFFDGRPTGTVYGDLGVWFRRPDTTIAANLSPDVFVVLDCLKIEREKWVVEVEGAGPDVVIELLSPKTARRDRTTKKDTYQNILKVPEYFMYHPYRLTREAFRLENGVYVSVPLDDAGRHFSEKLGLYLVPWQGTFEGITCPWLRWAYEDGTLLPTGAEAERSRAEAERSRAEAERSRAEAERSRAEALQAGLRAAEEERRWLEQRIAELEGRARGGSDPLPL